MLNLNIYFCKIEHCRLFSSTSNWTQPCVPAWAEAGSPGLQKSLPTSPGQNQNRTKNLYHSKQNKTKQQQLRRTLPPEISVSVLLLRVNECLHVNNNNNNRQNPAFHCLCMKNIYFPMCFRILILKQNLSKVLSLSKETMDLGLVLIPTTYQFNTILEKQFPKAPAV